MGNTTTIILAHIGVRGVVQGVGFRPFVYQLATGHNLRGWVCNTSGEVQIEIEGNAADIDTFLKALRERPPSRSVIESINVSYASPQDYRSFEIRESIEQEGRYQLVSPDIATCPDCLREILDSRDRRYRYPFTNCTNCGPRFTIIEDIPYDRPRTTMRKFRMCPECQQEYDNPLDRRFHAQPNACPVCGPRLEILDAAGVPLDCKDPLELSVGLIRAGRILAIKGLGGFLLACDATDAGAVELLRWRKKRPSKPFAVMMTSMEEVRAHCEVTAVEEEALTSPASPIVLLKWREGSAIPGAVAPNNSYLGVMLPYTPLHHLLMREAGIALVMTSGNLSEEPIARDNDEAVSRLSGIADYFLVHNRDIYARYDDSVVIVENNIPQVLRRARGYAPYPIHLPFKSKSVLACGAEEKNTFCLTRENHAFLSQHIGDMENLETYGNFTKSIELYRRLFRINPEIVAHDMHPGYLSTKYALQMAGSEGIVTAPVQHHHAHIASCMVDNGITEPVIGVSFDGTGYGEDGNLWGGEFMAAGLAGYRRLAHFQYLPLPGGATAIRKPYRIAAGYLFALFGKLPDLPFLSQISKTELEAIYAQVERQINTPLTSSCGRLFDAVSALLGVRGEIDYSAQAAIELEMCALEDDAVYPYSADVENGVTVIGVKETLAAIIEDVLNNAATGVISARFHNTIADMILSLCKSFSAREGSSRVALSGGVFQNRMLLRKAVRLLEANGLQVLTHRMVPCNDGGIAVGQAAIAGFSNR